MGIFKSVTFLLPFATIRNLKNFKVENSHIRKAITKIRSEGRLQNISTGKLRDYVSKNNKILIDGAHNPLAAFEIKKYLKNLNPKKKIVVLLAMMANKDHDQFIKILKDSIHSIVALDIPNQINFMPKEKLAKIAKTNGIISKTDVSIQTALKKISEKNNDAIIFCTGSLYFAGEILNLN